MRFRFLLAPVFTLLVCAYTAAAPAWPQAESDLAPDPATRFGALANGVRFAVRSNAEPRGRVALRLLVLAGSMHERDDQRGLAHFVEHMAFAGSRHFPPGTLVDLLQRHGFAFGADLSAFTFQAHTVYMLDAPSKEPGRLTEAMSVLRDFADGVTFAPSEVDRERGVVQSERRARDVWQSRAYDARTEFLHPDTLIPRRNPIGDEGVVQQATAEQLREFYQTWYRADNIVVVLVGDAPADDLEHLVHKHFDDLAAPTAPLPPGPDFGRAANPEKLATKLYVATESGAASVELSSVTPGRQLPETRAERDEQFRRELVMTMLNERMNQLRRDHSQDFGSASAVSSHNDPLYTETALRIDSSLGAARAAIGALGHQWRQAYDRGFTTDEIDDTVAYVRRHFQYAITATPVSREIADEIALSVVQHRVYSSWAQRWEQAQPLLSSFDPPAAHAAFLALWPRAPRLFVVGSFSLPDADAALSDAFAEGVHEPLETPRSGVLRHLLYRPAAQPGAITSRRHNADLNLELVEFANGVRLNLKRTSFRENLVYLRARVGWGMLSQPKHYPGLGLIAAAYVNEAGVGQHNGEELRRYLAAHNSNLVFAAEEDAFTFTGGSDTVGINDELTLLAAYLRDVAWRPSDFVSAQRQVASYYSNSLHDPAQSLSASALRVISADDSRLALPPYSDTMNRTFEQLLGWLEPALSNGPVEIGLTGDFDVEQTIKQAARTLGTLPARPVRNPLARGTYQPVTFSTKPGRWQTYSDTAIPRAIVRAQWPVRGCSDIHTRRQLEILGSVVGDLVRREIREKRGATYDPSAEVWNGSTDRDDGYLILTLSADPALASAISKDIARLGGELAARGATDEEFQAALQPRIAENESRLRTNDYWLYYVAAVAQEMPSHLDWPLTREADYREMPRADVNALAQRFLSAKDAQLFVAIPAPPKK
ncbi:insulinase family protein [Horticoccus luteus]|uniref:Insulinase family protein n=1 Tax=Horticoccus luteus TaxID=2862869 RepID=A0A8F9TVD9_9BACT|nr:M16 family metallopeptidase [Horticoccus luteus]QYM79964.1 insulinase family protein [Horticoccus luteus]